MARPWSNRRDRIIKPNRNGIRFFSYKTLRIATNNFSTLIGHGGFGRVFKGVLPDDGTPVAVKMFSPGNFDADRFLDMVEYMSHLRHTNLIQIIGCCLEKDGRLLVTEYAEKGSVEQLLRESTRSAFNWEMRAAVCIGTARALSYLHEDINPQVIHRDIKPPNILLDANFVPKVADFDAVRFVSRNSRVYIGGPGIGETDTVDPIMTNRIEGTYGYLSPEYGLRGELTKKVDVYAFGTSMLEIISGRRIYCLLIGHDDVTSDDLSSYNKVLRKDGMVLELVDPMLIDFPKDDVVRFLHVALLCTQLDPKKRPNMFEVVLMLHGVYKSNQEISEMYMRAITGDPPQWYSLLSDAEDGGMLDTVSYDSSTVVTWENGGDSKGEETCKETAHPLETPPASSSTRAQSCEMTDVSLYFQRSIQKIKESQAKSSSCARSSQSTRMAQTMVTKRVSMEAVYPPFPSNWEYPPSNAFCKQNWQ